MEEAQSGSSGRSGRSGRSGVSPQQAPRAQMRQQDHRCGSLARRQLIRMG